MSVRNGVLPGYEKLIECPYEKAHQILPERMQTHLVKCRRSHPDVKKVECPFNATHLVGECELKYHTDHCPDSKKLITHLLDYDQEKVFEPVPIQNYEIECSENWDNINVPTYDPSERLAKEGILVNKHGLKPAERRLFQEQERRRHAQLQDMSKSATTSCKSSDIQIKAPRRPISVAEIKKDPAVPTTSKKSETSFVNNSMFQSASEYSDSSITSTRYPDTSDTDATLINKFDEMSIASTSATEEQWITAKRKSKPVRGRGRSFPSNK